MRAPEDVQAALGRPPLQYQVEAVDPRADAGWRQLAEGRDGSLFISPPWIEAVCATYGFQPQGWLVRGAGGEPLGAAAYVEVDDIRGTRCIALPFSDRADPVAPCQHVWQALSEPFVSGPASAGYPLTVRLLDDQPASGDERFRTVGEATWHSTALDRPIAEIFERLGGHVRRNIRNAERRGVRVEVSDSMDSVREMHKLQVRLRREKYGLLAQPLSFFEAIWERFSPQGDIMTCLAYLDERPIAGAMYLTWGGALYYKFGASLREHLDVRPNEAITWAAMRHGAERGLRHLDWGLSDLDQPGLIAYKRKWATDERRLITRRIPASSTPSPAQVQAGQVLGELTRLLTAPDVPEHVVTRAGAILYRYFC